MTDVHFLMSNVPYPTECSQRNNEATLKKVCVHMYKHDLKSEGWQVCVCVCVCLHV